MQALHRIALGLVRWPGAGFPASSNSCITFATAALLALCMAACSGSTPQNPTEKGAVSNPYTPQPYVKIKHPEWSKSAAIYEVNIRQYTEEGTFNAFAEHLPRLQQLGVDILWLMPIHPIGEEKRKGEKGSYYSVKDYRAVNPEFGTMKDLKALVAKAHDLGMYVILDWVANHSAWDNPLTQSHPEWYSKNIQGQFQPTPWWDWSDVIDFEFQNAAFRQYMTESLKYWVEEADVDGYRADVAGFIPVDFWDNVRRELDEIKPVFMLAEWESRDIHANAFDMSYGWDLYTVLHEVTQGKGDATKVRHYFAHLLNGWPRDAIKMNFVDNHDKNSWDGTTFGQFGEGLELSMVTTVLAEGMPLIYSGQEAGMNKQLAFFDKDLIPWQEHPHGDLYRQLLALKENNRALWNGHWGGAMLPLENSNPSQVFSFYREMDGHKVLAVLNFSNKAAEVTFTDSYHYGEYHLWPRMTATSLDEKTQLTLQPWGYQVFVVQ